MSLFLYSFLSGCLGAGLILKIGSTIGINDVPNHRSSHSNIIPKGGGIGILAAFLISSYLLKLPSWLWISCLVISMVSLWGDRRDIPPRIRLGFQFSCSFLFLTGVYFFSNLSLVLAVFCFVPLLIFLTGTANFYNFMDGIDGIAGITGLVAFGLLAANSHLLGCWQPWGYLSGAMALSCLGFLMFNFPRAKVFMGDVGSILLGFCFACLVIMISDSVLDFFVMAGFLFPFYCDELVTIWVRLKKKESLLVPHRQHIYQLIANELETPHWKISLGYGLSQLLVGGTLMGISSTGWGGVLLVYLGYGLLFLAFSMVIHKKSAPKGCN